MREFQRPRVFCSKCLGFARCRWNGDVITDALVQSLKECVDFFTACPEYEIGLGVPRDPVRIVSLDGEFRLMQLNTKRDVTSEMRDFTEKCLDGVGEVDGFILKDRSPSCGIKDVKVYAGLEPGPVIMKANGFFASGVMDRFSETAVETEGRLSNFNLREHFLIRVYTSAEFRKVRKSQSMGALVDFHARNKFLFMATSQKETRILGNIVANHERLFTDRVFDEYGHHLALALAKPAKYSANINVLMHGLGYFSDGLNAREKAYFLNTLEEYRREQVPLSVPLRILREFIVRFENSYLDNQTFFEPFPHDLVAVRDSGKTRV